MQTETRTKPDIRVPNKPSTCSKCKESFPDGQPAACLRTYGKIEGDPDWQYIWVCRECLASNWRYA